MKLSKVICGKTFRVSACMKVIKDSELDAFRGDKNDYGGLGLVRCLGIACRGTLIDDTVEWDWFKDMSDGLKIRLRSLGIYEYDDAERCRSCLQSSLSLTQYSLSDLVVFVCLLDKSYLPAR